MKIFKSILLSTLLLLCCIACGPPPPGGGGSGDAQVDVGINRQVNPTPINPNPGQAPPS